MPKLTQRTLESIGPDRAGTTVRDEGNLVGKVNAKVSGEISVAFYYRFRFDGKLRDFSCGTWPADSLSAVRANRDLARTKVASGIDPRADRKIERHERQAEVAARLAEMNRKRDEDSTVKDVFDAWLLDGVRRKDGNAELQRSFNADVLPMVGSIKIIDLTEHHLRSALRRMVDRGVNRAAVMVRNSLTQMFAWAEKRQPWRKLLAEGNPMDLIEIEKIVSPDYDLTNVRDRYLSDDEIKELQTVLRRMRTEYEEAKDRRAAQRPLELATECAIWIMLSTMVRVGELTMARWNEVDLIAAKWFIPKKNVKDSTGDLTVYLSPFAVTQFERLKQRTGHTEWCFPGRDDTKHMDVKGIAKQVGDRQTMFKKGKDGTARQALKNRRHDNTLVLGNGKHGAWTPHDLRRTGATLMQRLGVPLEMIDRCQNHVLPGSKVRRHYLHHDYADEKCAAWATLGEHLTKLLNDKTVVGSQQAS